MSDFMERMIEEGRTEGKREGRREGKREGRREGIQVLIESFQELGRDYDETSRRVESKYHLSRDDAQAYMRTYWREA